MKKVILIGGGTGLVGTRIVELIDSSKYDIRILTRSPKPNKDNVSYYKWDIKNHEIDPASLNGVDYIINLTGAGVADKKWTDSRKKILIDSRVNSNLMLKKGLERHTHRLKAFICASAVGYYGSRGEEVLTEESNPGQGFLAECCQKWEDSADELSSFTDRLVKLRIGIVLSTKGGALPKMLMTKSLGIYSYFGNGKQYYPWIHIDDVARMFIAAIKQQYSGVYNAVSPEPLTNKIFTQKLKNILGGWLVAPAPALVMKIVLGEMSEVVLGSNRVLPKKLRSENFEYKFPDLKSAIQALVK